MNSGRQRRVQLRARRSAKRVAARATQERELARERARQMRGQVLVNPDNLRPTGSYGTPDFVARGFYLDRPFACKHCGKPQLWTATQQKWWYESAKGDVWTIATLCRPCRARERARKEEARKIHLDGLARKGLARKP